MQTSGDFRKYYTTVSNVELLEVLSNEDDYQQEAVIAAKNELDFRQLSQDDLNDAKNLLTEKRLQQKIKIERVTSIKSKIKNAGSEVIDSINPIQPERPTVEKTIRIVAIFYGIIFVYMLVFKFRDIYIGFLDIKDGHFYPISYVLFFCLLPVAVYLFFKKRKTGWTLLTGLICYLVVGVVITFIDFFTYQSSGILSELFPRPSIISAIIQLIFVATSLFAVCKQDVRIIFGVNRNLMISTIVLGILLTVFIIVET